jgi:hypothetical protein
MRIGAHEIVLGVDCYWCASVDERDANVQSSG